MALSNDQELFGYYCSLIANDGIEERTYDDFDMKFKVRKTGDTKPNVMEIEVYNLPEEDRVFLDPKNVNLRLIAGYEKVHGQIFRGASEFTGHEYGDLDWISKLTAKDGGIQARNTFINISFKKGTPQEQVLEKLIQQLTKTPEIEARFAAINKASQGKLDLVGFVPKSTKKPDTKRSKKPKTPPPVSQQEAKLLKQKQAQREKAEKKKLEKGLIIRGAATEKLNIYCASFGLKAYWTDQTLSIIPLDAALEDELIQLDYDSGLLGQPERIETGWKLTSLLRHEFNPGHLVYVESDFLVGNFLISTVEHEGDTMSDLWQSTLEVKDVGFAA